MGSLTNFPIDQVDSIGVDIEVNNLSDEHFRDVMEELTNHQIPEREKCPLVRRLNASISGYFKSTGDVGFSKMIPNNSKGSNGDKIMTDDLPGGACGNNNNNNNNHVIAGAHGLDDSNSIEMVEYRRTFELKNYHSPKNCHPSDTKSKSCENKRSDGSNSSSVLINSSSSLSSSSSTANCKIPDSSLTSNLNQNGSSVDSFVNFDSLKRPPSEPTNEQTEDANLNNNITTYSNVSTNSNQAVNNTNSFVNDNNKDVSKDNSNSSNNNNNNSSTTNINNATATNNKGNRAASNSKAEKKKKSKKGETVYTAQDIDGHIGDQSIDDLVYYVTGNKGEIGGGVTGSSNNITVVGTGNGSGIVGGGGPSNAGGISSSGGGYNNNGTSVYGPTPSENKLTTANPKNNKEGNSGGKVKKKEKSSSTSPTSTTATTITLSSSVNNSTSIQGRNKKGSNNNSNIITSTSTTTTTTTISTVNNTLNCNSNNFNNANISSVNCASTNGNASDNDVKNFGNKYEKIICCVDSGLGKSIPRSSSATTFDSKFPPSTNVAQCVMNSSSLNASSTTSPVLSKSHSTESSSSANSNQPVTKQISGTGIMSKSKVKEFDPTKESSNGLKDKNSDKNKNKKSTTANGDLENSYMELRYAASDPEMVDQETSFQTVKSKHLKRRKGVSRNKGDLRMSSPLPRSSNHNIFTNSSSSTSTTPSVTSSTSNSVNISMTARGYESEREYCADEFRRRKECLNRRKLASSMPHSEQNSADNSDMESSCSYPVSGRMPILPTPPGPPASSSSISSTPKVSYADIAKMGSVIGVTPSLGVTKGPQSTTNVTLNNNSKSDNNNINCSVKDDNNNINSINISGSTDTSPKINSTVDSGLSTSIQTNNSTSTSCSPYFNSSPNCISPSGFSSPSQIITEGSKTVKINTNNNQINRSPESSVDATLSKENPPTIKSETNCDQEISPKDGKAINYNSSNHHQQQAAVAIRPKNFKISKETKMENQNQKVINEDNNSNNNHRSKHDKKMEKAIQQSTVTTKTTTNNTSCAPTNSSDSNPSTATSVTTSIVTKTASKSISSSSKTLEALLSPPAGKTPTFDMKKENQQHKLSDSRISSTKSDTSRASMLKKSNSTPGASVKNDSFRVRLNESHDSKNSTNHSKLPTSLPPVIMNDDSDAVDEVESPFTFGFFEDVTSSSNSSSNLAMSFVSTTTASKTTIKPSDSTMMSKFGTKKVTKQTTLTSSPSSTITTATSTTSTGSTVNNKNNNYITSSFNSHVKSSKIASTSTPAHSTAATIINSVKNSDSTSLDTSKSLEAVIEAPQERKITGKDCKSSSDSSSLEKFIAIKLAEPPTNLDADTNTFNYSQIINFIKTAWESVMCQYQRSPDKNNSRNSSKGDNLFHESTTYYKELILP